MRKFLGTLVILVLIVAGIGVFRGWFGISTEDQAGETQIELTIDKDKIKQDAQAASQKARDMGSSKPEAASEEVEVLPPEI